MINENENKQAGDIHQEDRQVYCDQVTARKFAYESKMETQRSLIELGKVLSYRNQAQEARTAKNAYLMSAIKELDGFDGHMFMTEFEKSKDPNTMKAKSYSLVRYIAIFKELHNASIEDFKSLKLKNGEQEEELKSQNEQLEYYISQLDDFDNILTLKTKEIIKIRKALIESRGANLRLNTQLSRQKLVHQKQMVDNRVIMIFIMLIAFLVTHIITARKLYFLQSQAFAIMVNVTKPLKGIANLAPLRNPLLEDANLALSDEKDSSSTPSGVVDKSSPVAVSSESATHISQPLVDDSASSSAMAPSGVCVEEKEESLDQELIRLVDFAMLTNDTAKRIALMGAVLQPNEPEDMQQLGGILFSIINLLLPYIAGKLVGMILEQDYDQILLLLSDSVQLASSIRMCLKVIINDEKYGCCFNPGGYCQYGMHWPGSRMPACPHYVIGSRHRGAAIHIENYIRYKKQAATLHALGHRSDKKCGSDVTAKSTTQPSTRRLVLGRGIAPGGTLEELKMDTAPVRGWGMSSEATMTMQEIQAAQELLLSEYDSANTYQLKTFTGLSAGNMQKRKKLQKEKLAAEAVESAARKARIAVHVAKLDATRAERNKVHSLKPVSSYSYTFMPPNKRSPVPSSRAGVFGNRDGRSHLCRNRGVAKFEWELREDDFEDFNPVGEPQHSGYACVQIDRKGKECRKNNCYETWHMCHGCKRRTLMQQGKFEKGEGNAPNPTLLAQAREKKTIKDACKYSHMTNLYFKNQYRNIEAGLTHLENKLLKTTNPREVRELQDSIDHLHALRYHLPDLDEPVKVSAPADEKAGRKTLRARPSPLVWTMNPLLMKLASSPVAPKKLLSSRMVVVYRTVKGRGVRPVTVRSSKSVQGAPPLTVMSSIAEGIEIVEDDVSLQSSQDCHDINSVMFMFEAHVSGALPEIKVSEVVPADYMLLADYDPETFTHHRTTRYKIKNKTRYMNSPQTDCTARLDQFICPKCAVKKGLDRKIVYTGTSPLFDAKWYANQIQLVNLGVSSMVAGMKGVSPNTSRHIENTTKIALYREHLTFFIAEQARAAKFESV